MMYLKVCIILLMVKRLTIENLNHFFRTVIEKKGERRLK
jgi:type IV secretory pathway VirB3-like protein